MRGAATTAAASVVLSEELGAPPVDHDHTQLVVPLPLDSDIERAPKRASGRRWRYAGAAIVLFAAATLAVTIATSSELPKPVATKHAAVVVPAPAPTPEPVIAPAPPSAEVVAASAAAAPPPTEMKAADAPELTAAAPADDRAPTAAAVAPKSASVERPPVRRPSARPVKKAAKPKYDPDALFFKGK